MEEKRQVQAGTLESCDAFVSIARGPSGSGLTISLESAVASRFGDEMRQRIRETAKALEVTDLEVRVVDRGALNFVLQARVETAIRRLLQQEEEGRA